VDGQRYSRRRMLGSAIAGLFGFLFAGRRGESCAPTATQADNELKPRGDITTYDYDCDGNRSTAVYPLGGVSVSTLRRRDPADRPHRRAASDDHLRSRPRSPAHAPRGSHKGTS